MARHCCLGRRASCHNAEWSSNSFLALYPKFQFSFCSYDKWKLLRCGNVHYAHQQTNKAAWSSRLSPLRQVKRSCKRFLGNTQHWESWRPRPCHYCRWRPTEWILQSWEFRLFREVHERAWPSKLLLLWRIIDITPLHRRRSLVRNVRAWINFVKLAGIIHQIMVRKSFLF